MRCSAISPLLLPFGCCLIAVQILAPIAATPVNCHGDESTLQAKTNEPQVDATTSTTTTTPTTTTAKTITKCENNESPIEVTAAPAPSRNTNSSSSGSEVSDVQKILNTVQSTLEKARPWMEEIEKEAKRLEQTAKRFGEGVIHRLTGIFEKLFTNDDHTASISTGASLRPHDDDEIGGVEGSSIAAEEVSGASAEKPALINELSSSTTTTKSPPAATELGDADELNEISP